jgi:adenylate cyclase
VTSSEPDASVMEAAEPPSATEVLAQVAKITAHREFSLPERGRSFLRYIVEETLAGRGDRIKGYSVAVAVFERRTTFDAQSDPVVRIEAGRLRRALAHYYLGVGQIDPIIIEIPKGRYIPLFARNPASAGFSSVQMTLRPLPVASIPHGLMRKYGRIRLMVAFTALVAAFIGSIYLGAGWLNSSAPVKEVGPSAPAKPKLLVLPFRDTSETSEGKVYAAGFADEIINQLSAFKELIIFGSETSRSAAAQPEIARLRDELDVGYVVRGSVRISGGQARVTAQTVDAKTQAVLWSHTFADNLTAQNLIQMQDLVARETAMAVAQPYGIVFRADANKLDRKVPDDLEAYLCTLRFYGYRAELSPERHAAVRECLERAVSKWPNYATAWAMLSQTYLDEDRFGFNPKHDVQTEDRAIRSARRAVSLEPDNMRALQSLMLALFFDQHVKEALAVGDHGLLLNPNDPEFRGEFGSRLALSGDWNRGSELLEGALSVNPGNTNFYRGVLALGAYLQGDLDRAVREIRRAELSKFPLFHVVAAIIYTERGMKAEGASARDEFLRLRPSFFEHFDDELTKRNFRIEDQARLIEGARKAGFPVPAQWSPP